ncbi:type III secretion system inner rod subunit SctI [Endozoicomonas sp. Mp262]|uniref:type III secretion system inner rod subunit SctI n=1 Tax=Endozoicomonas sp. Mp262 TaxID=2919499 RepID=UPI0021D7F86E
MVGTEGISAVTQSALELTDSSSQVDEVAVEQFEQAFAGNHGDSLGQDVIEGLGDIRESYNQKVESITQSASELSSPAEMLQLQFQVSSLTLQQDLLAKTAGKSNQNLETLLKMQ